MYLDDDAVCEIESSLIAAAIRSERWEDVVAQLAAATGARGVAAIPLKGRVPGLPMSDSLEALGDSYFRDGWSKKDYRANGIPKLQKTGLFVDQDFTTPEAMESEPFYVDYLRRHGFQWSAGLMVEAGDDAWAVTLQRTIDQGPYTPDEQTSLRRLIAPLNRAAQLAHNLGEARVAGMADALESVQTPSLLLNRTGRVLRISSGAEALLGTDLQLRLGELTVPSDAQATSALRAHIAAAIWTDPKATSLVLAPVIVRRTVGRPLILLAQPLRKAGLEYFDGCRAILTITDLNVPSRTDDDLLKRLYGLTSREAELCTSLMSGLTLNECADWLGMSVHTTRAHLKKIFAKTETHSQTDLILLFMRQPRA